MDDRTLRVLIVCITVATLASMALLTYQCQTIDERREKCIELGKTSDECRRLFNMNETRHQ